jgi:aminoglycoside phosphotransferase (APT) family kinase protein
MVEFAAGAYAQVWPACAAIFEGILPAEALTLGGRLTEILADMMNAVAAPPFTLAHGDARHENLLFDPADESAAPHVVDWQLTARGRGVMDVAYYLTQSGAPDITAAHERALVERYHDELCRGGVSDYSLEKCWEDYRRFAYYALVYPVFAAGTADPDNEDQLAAIAVILERAVSAILRLDAAEFS